MLDRGIKLFWLFSSGITSQVLFFSGDYCMNFWLLMVPYVREDFAWSLDVFMVRLLRLLGIYLLIAHRLTKFGFTFGKL